ncbi:MAG: transposase [Anaerolineae bacterium]|nr:transposase [Anaerolineae bacterium]
MTPTEALFDYLDSRGLSLDRRYLREALHTLAQALMECEVSRVLDAAPYERNGARRAYRNGYRDSLWHTSVGDLSLSIPKLRKGSYYPLFLTPQAEAILLRLAQETYASGVHRADVRAALAALDLPELEPYELADIVERLADVVYNHQHAPLRTDYPALFLDVLDVEHNGLWRQWLIALGIQPSGQIDLLAHELVSAADHETWVKLLRRLRQRGVEAVEVVVSREFTGLRPAVTDQLVDAVWQPHRNFLLRGSGEDALVSAVSDLAVRVETDPRHLPRMLWPGYAPDSDFALANFPVFVLA